MSIYVGETTTDLNYLMNNDTVSASVYVGNDHVWPLYEFSFYDGTMQKTIDNIASNGTEKSFTLRTCEDSWWHKLNFDVHYTFLSGRTTTPAVGQWLNRFAEDFIVDTTTHWIETSVATGSISPANSVTVQSVEFADNYSSFDGGTCVSTAHDIEISCKVYPNQWFLPREGKLHCVQYDEWGNKSGGQVGNAMIATPSDNYPTIFFTQVANAWGTNAQTVEFSATPATTGPQGGKVNLKWKIYSDSTSEYTIYYGDDIASNNTSKDGAEEYAVGKMWITINGSSALSFDNNATYNATTKEWTATATWADNSASGSNASHNIVFDTGSAVGTEGGDRTITAKCVQSSLPRYATITLNVGDKNNWRPASSSKNLTQEGETIETTCYVSLSNDFTDEKTSVTVNFPAIPEPTKNYSLSLQNSSLTQVGPEAGSFNVISYYTTESVDGKSVTIYAKCPDGENTASTTITQASLGASKVAVDVSADCVDGTESVTASKTSSTYVATISYSEHSTPGEYDDEIVVTQEGSGNTLSVVHIAKADIKKTYSYRVVISTAENATTTRGSFSILASGTSQTLYGRLFESCYCTIDNVYSKDDSYDDKAISWATNSESGAALASVSFSLSGGNNVSGTKVWSLSVVTPTNSNATACELQLTGSKNDDASSELIRGTVDLSIVEDTYTTIGNSLGSTASFKVKATRPLYTGGFTRSGSVEGEYQNAYTSSSFVQYSSVQQTATGNSEIASNLSLSCTTNYSGFTATSTETSTAGTYNIVIKVSSVWSAGSDAATTGWSNIKLSYVSPSTGTYSVSTSDVDSNVTLKVSAKGTKTYLSDSSGNSSRNITCTVSYDDSVTCKAKKQTIVVGTGAESDISGLTISWTQNTNSSLAGSLTKKDSSSNNYWAELPIIKGVSGAENDIQGTVTATVSGYEVSKTFTITWPAGGYTPPASTNWTLTVYYDLTNNTGSDVVAKCYTTVDAQTSEISDLSATGNVTCKANDNEQVTKSIDYTTAQGSLITYRAHIEDVNTPSKSTSRTLTINAGNTQDKSLSVSMTWSTTVYTVTGSWVDGDSTICHTDSVKYKFTAKKDGSANNNVTGVTISNTSAFSISVGTPSNGVYEVTVTGKSSNGGESATLSIPKGDGTYHTATVKKLACIYISFTSSSPSINIGTDPSITLNYGIYVNGTKQATKPSWATVSCADGNVDTYGSIVVSKSKFSTASSPKTITVSLEIGTGAPSYCDSCTSKSDSVSVTVTNVPDASPYAEFWVGSSSVCHNSTVGVYYAYHTDAGVSGSKISGKDTVKFKVGTKEYNMSYNTNNARYEGSVTVTGDTTVTFPSQTGVLTPGSTSKTITRTDTYTFKNASYSGTYDACTDTVSITVGVNKNGTTDTSATITAGKLLSKDATISGRTVSWDLSSVADSSKADGKTASATISVGSGSCGSSVTFTATFKNKWKVVGITEA